jgi:hypothetical protein
VSITAITRTVYRAPKAGRNYLTLRAACLGEARAIIKSRYPSEAPEYEAGHMIHPGATWHDLPRSDVLYRRMARRVRAAYEAAKGGAA